LYTFLFFFIEELFKVLCCCIEGRFILRRSGGLPLFSESPFLQEFLSDLEGTDVIACGRAGRRGGVPCCLLYFVHKMGHIVFDVC
jgi:hypothetical protein